jgi:peptidoglycan/xylan/chitin deacetylase (PgdA/CDA1 family)
MITPAPAPVLPYEAQLATPAGRARELARRLVAATARPFGTLVRVATRQPAVALTFDDGPHPLDTPPVLALLERHGARGTFFMVGTSAARHPELVARVTAGGHAVANHSWDHPSFLRIDAPERAEQLHRCAEALGPHAAPLFRPPFGDQGIASLYSVRRAGLVPVAWDVVAEDWSDAPADHLLGRILRRLRRGSIVVFHDTLHVTDDERFRDRAPMREALARLLERLSPGVRFVTIPELMRLGRPVWWHHYHRLPESFFERLHSGWIGNRRPPL